MSGSASVSRKRVGLTLLIALVWWLLLSHFPDVLGFGLGISILISAVLGWILLVVGIPFLFWVIAGPVYRIFFKPYIRVWRINRIRDARLLKETLNRTGRET